MSRIIVKNLPIYYTEDKLKDFFSKKGDVTDVKLMKKRNGESRKFAFIGYKSNIDAENAVKFYHSSFIDTARIDVQLAKTFSDPTVPLPWKEKRRLAEQQLKETEEKLRKLEEFGQKNKRQKKSSAIDSKIEGNHKLQEYLEAVKPQSRSWANDEVVNADGAPSSKGLEDALKLKDMDSSKVSEKPHVSLIMDAASDDEYEEFNKGGSDSDGNDDESGDKMISLADLDKKASDHNKEDIQEPPSDMDDMEWLRMKRTRIKEYQTGEEQEEEQQVIEKKKAKEERKKPVEVEAEVVESEIEKKEERQSESESEPELTEKDITIQKISELGRLFLRNILYTADEQDFRDLFSPFGELEEVHIAVDTRNGSSKGFAHIKFNDPKDAVQAYLELDKQIFQGRLLHILPGQPKKDHTLDEFDLANLPLKKQRELKRKYQASQQQFSWNSLYMNNDAVMESVAGKLGISKSELIDPQNSSSAVKQALAEAHIIGDVRKYFETKGVDLTSFDKKERDDKIILVKNFQHGTTQEEIGEMFSVYGQLNRVLMPPAGTIAIVEFRDAPPARKAFNKLAYRRLGKSIIYLEKGPKDLFTATPTESDTVNVEKKSEDEGKEAKITTTEVMDIDKVEESAETNVGSTTSIFVKNLNFSTTPADLTKIFKPLDGFLVATIKTKPDSKNAGKTLSMGFGFAEFKTKEQANAAISSLDGYSLDGHKLQLKISTRVSQQSSSSSSILKKSKRTNKIIVKNLAFECTRKDIFELFNSFGNLKSVRVPKKFNKSARGFAFVEFSTLKEAESAMDQLQGVHLLGRRLVLDYAELESGDAEAEIEKMTKKAKTQTNTRRMADLRESNTGKRKLDLEDEEEGFNLNQL